MSGLDPNIPRSDGVEGLGADPMAYLREWRAALGDLYALPVEGALLSRTADCSGVVAVFGHAHQQAVLGDIERYVLPVSAAVGLALPPRLRNLNAGLHGLRGSEHARQKQLLAQVLSGADADAVRAATERSAVAVRSRLRECGQPLLASMRALVLEASARLLFGATVGSGPMPERLMRYFQLRREAAAPWHVPGAEARERLIEVGHEVDAGLREYRRLLRSGAAGDFGVLAALAMAPEASVDADGFVAHANVLFISCNEPVAVALTWTLLVLSQLPDLRARLRSEWRGRVGDGDSLPLLDAVLSESLRVLTPNALMVRVARTPVRLGRYRLPADCELLLCPFLSHRDPVLFPRPSRFMPSRWAGLRPSPYEYFPFGAGGHACVGRALARRLLRDALAALIESGEIVLDGDAAVDWRVHVMLMPSNDPEVRWREVGDARSGDSAVPGRLSGGVLDIVAFSDEFC